MTENVANLDGVARLRSVGRNPQDPCIERLDDLCRLVTFELKQFVAFSNQLAFLFQPAAKRAFVHRPAKPRNNDFNGMGGLTSSEAIEANQ